MRIEKAPNCGSFLCNTANKRTFYGDNARKGISCFEFLDFITFNDIAKMSSIIGNFFGFYICIEYSFRTLLRNMSLQYMMNLLVNSLAVYIEISKVISNIFCVS